MEAKTIQQIIEMVNPDNSPTLWTDEMVKQVAEQYHNQFSTPTEAPVKDGEVFDWNVERDKLTTDLNIWTGNKFTNEEIADRIVEGIKSWFEHLPIHPPKEALPPVQEINIRDIASKAIELIQYFVDRVEAGTIRSKTTYGKYKEFLNSLPTEPSQPLPSVTGEDGWIKKATELLKEYEQWEADLIADNAMWWPHVPKDRISGKTYDKMLELQSKRNKLLPTSKQVNL